MLLKENTENGKHAVELADLFCAQARERVKAKFGGLWRNEDVQTYKAAQDVLKGEHLWLEQGMVEVKF
jgi:hypothetical protein